MDRKGVPDGLSRRQLLARILGLSGAAAGAPIFLNTTFAQSVLAAGQAKRKCSCAP